MTKIADDDMAMKKNWSGFGDDEMTIMSLPREHDEEKAEMRNCQWRNDNDETVTRKAQGKSCGGRMGTKKCRQNLVTKIGRRRSNDERMATEEK